MTEGEKMLAGLGYDARDPELVAGRRAARMALQDFNGELDEEGRMKLLGDLLGACGEGSFVEAPFFCDYGTRDVPARTIAAGNPCRVIRAL